MVPCALHGTAVSDRANAPPGPGAVAQCPTMPQQWALRARIVLAAGQGEAVRATARRLEVTPATVCQWRQRYSEGGLAALKTRERSGRPRRISDAKEQLVVAKTLTTPKATTHWSCRRLARGVGLSPSTVHRIWRKYDLQPHRTTTFRCQHSVVGIV
jgi:transposase